MHMISKKDLNTDEMDTFDEIVQSYDSGQEMGSPRQAVNRRRRTRKGPEPACVQTPL